MDLSNPLPCSSQEHSEDARTTPFIGFYPKSAIPTRKSTLKRNYTRSKPINVKEFESAFEEHASTDRTRQASTTPAAEVSSLTYHGSNPPLVRAHSQPLSLESPDTSYYALEEAEYSDTAKLTANIADVARDESPPPSFQSFRPYEPAPVSADEDFKKRQSIREQVQQHQPLHTMAAAIRRLSRRVVNMNNLADVSPRPHRTSIMLPIQEPVKPVSHEDRLISTVEEVIPLTVTSSKSSTRPLLPTNDAAPPSENRNEKDAAKEPVLISNEIYLVGNSCGIFSPENPLRQWIARLLCWQWTETLIMLLIALHGTILLVVGWGTDPTPEPAKTWGETWDQYALLVIFCLYTLTAIARIIVYGLIRNPRQRKESALPKAYLRHSWNRIDFVAVISYWIHLALLCTHQEIVDETRRILVFKMMSAILLLRLLNVTAGSKVILHSLKKAGPLLVRVLFFVGFFFIIFAIIGVQCFKGSFLRHCVWTDPEDPSHHEELQQYCGGYMENGQVQPFILKNGERGPWSKGFICSEGLVCRETENPFGNTISFDNIFSSMLMVMIITGDQTWTDRMYDMMDADYFVACLYFIVIVIVMNFWLINLFVAVINEMFAKVREDSQHSAFTTSTRRPVLADADEGWSFGDGVKKQVEKPSLFAIVVTKMRPFWIVLVAVDLIVMASKNNDMSPDYLELLSKVELGFSLAFLLEILLRLASQRRHLKVFFQDTMNRADLLIAVVTCIIWIPPIHDHQLVYAWLSGFQVLRIYRIVVAIPRMRSLMSRVLGSVHGLINLVFFIVLATLICALIAFQLFEGVLNDSDNEMRFFSIYNSFAALYQLFSGEDWTTVLYDAMEAGAPTGNAAVHATFLVLWFAFSNFVLVNMFIAILMENFETAEEQKRERQVQHFIQTTEVQLDSSDVTSRWNIYRHFREQPKGVTINNMPTNLVLPVRKNVIREFMNGPAESTVLLDKKKPKDEPNSKAKEEEGGWIAKVRHTLSRLLTHSHRHDNTSTVFTTNNTTGGRIINSDNLSAFELLSLFHDNMNRSNTNNGSQTLRDVISNLQETAVARSAETTQHDLEERRALKQEFILNHPTYDKSLYIFSQSNLIRRWCQLLVPPSRGERMYGTAPSRIGSLIFSVIIVCCVVTNVVLTVYNSPVYQFEHRHDPDKLKRLAHADWAFTVIFTVELVVKIIADGVLWTPNAYLHNGWNILDLFVLVTLYMSNFGKFAASTGLERGFRAFKALRALRLINLLNPAKIMFTSILVTGLPRILDAAALGICLIVPFALYGQNVFQGLFYQCNDDDDLIGNKSMCVYEAMLETQEPMPDGSEIYKPRVWSNPYVYSFDSFWKSLLVLFEIASGEGWVDVMETSMSIVGRDQSPQQDASQLAGIFFMVYNLAGSVFVISLFLGVVLENFAKRNGTAYLTADQRRWLDLKKLLNQLRPAKRPKVIPTGRFRRKCYDVVVEKRGKFYKVMTAIIIINILMLCTDTDHDDSVPGLTEIKSYVYLGFIFIYWIEISIKLFGLGWNSFRRNGWNLYDLVVVIGSAISVIATLGSQVHQVNVESQKLFMTALCFKLVQRSDSLNQLFTTMLASCWQILNVFAVWFVVMTTYAIMFMEIFGLTKYGSQATTEHINFRSYANTMTSLVRYSTGEAWNSVMHDFTVEYPNCHVADNYLDSDCGSLRWGYFLFLSFNIISMYIFTAIFLAVVADNFSYVYQVAANFSLVNRDEIRKFKRTWADFDLDRTGFISSKHYMAFWRQLSGIFSVRIYDPEISYKNLVSKCMIEEAVGSATDDPYRIKVDLAKLSELLRPLDKPTIHARKRDLDMLYWEAAMVESSKGVSFNQMLLMLVQRKLIVPENALVVEELLANRMKDDTIKKLISIDRVIGLIETVVLRKKFLRHLEAKKSQMKKQLPSIVIDHGDVHYHHRREATGSAASPLSTSIPGTPLSPASDGNPFDHLHDETSPRSSNYPSPTWEHLTMEPDVDAGYTARNTPDDASGHSLWHDLLQEEIDH